MTSTDDIIFQLLTTSGHDLEDNQIEGRAYGLPHKGFTNEKKTILFRSVGDSLKSSGGSIIGAEFEFRCFGGSDDIDDAKTVYRSLFDRMAKVNAETVAAGIVQRGFFQTSSFDVEADTGFPIMIAFFNFNIEAA